MSRWMIVLGMNNPCLEYRARKVPCGIGTVELTLCTISLRVLLIEVVDAMAAIGRIQESDIFPKLLFLVWMDVVFVIWGTTLDEEFDTLNTIQNSLFGLLHSENVPG